MFDSPTRLFILSMARKNAKTALISFLLLCGLVGPLHRRNGQLYSAAQSKEQAALVFEYAAKCVRFSPDLSAVIKIRDTYKEMECPDLGTKYKALAAEAATSFGKNPFFLIHDELGQVKGPRSALYEALETATGVQDAPLSLIISTQSSSDNDLLSILIDDALSGEDPKTKCVLYAADKEADPFSEEAIRDANPHLDDFMNKDEVWRQADAAKRMPSSENAFRNLILNQRVSADSPFVSGAIWAANSAEPREEDFQNGIVMGLDLSKRVDLTALVYVGRGDDGQYSVGCDFFAPKEGVDERSITDRVPYDLWAEQGHLTLTPGKTVGFDFVAKRMIELCERYSVSEIKFDRWGIPELQAELKQFNAEGLPLEPHGQGFKDMSPALAALEAELINERIRHGGHPILTWCAANAVVDMDAAGNRKLNKKRATGRIDGMVALAMAIGGAVVAEDNGSLDDFLTNIVSF
jgi:phage terminase large subunit-like protein